MTTESLVDSLEGLGFDSLWLGEHSHVPVAVASHPREDGRPLPDFYKRLPDPFVQLGAAAAVTSRITLGTAVCIIVEHDPDPDGRRATLKTFESKSGAFSTRAKHC